MPQECWKLARGLRAVTAAYGLLYVGVLYVIMRFFFPSAFLIPVMITAGVLYVALCFAQIRVALDRAGGEVAITTGLWTRHVRLTQIEQVQVRRSGAEIRASGGDIVSFGPFWASRRLERLLPVRSGFEGMELAIPHAAADARAADPGKAAAEDADSRRAVSRRKIPGACFACAMGLFSLAATAVVQPQAGGWLVHSAALLLRVCLATAGGLAVLLGAWLTCSAWRDRRTARQQG